MGKRGPAKRPTQLAILHGEKPSRINHDEPLPDEGTPDVPYEMDEEVREVWDFAVHQLGVMRTLSPADRDTLVAYCEAVVMHRRTSRALRDQDLLVPGAMGGRVRNPLVQMQRDAATLVRVLAREFGLTPSARSDISAAASRPGSGTAAGPERLLS